MKKLFHIRDTKTDVLVMDHRGALAFDNKHRAKKVQDKLNDKHNGWPVYGLSKELRPKDKKPGQRIEGAAPRFIIVRGPNHSSRNL